MYVAVYTLQKVGAIQEPCHQVNIRYHAEIFHTLKSHYLKLGYSLVVYNLGLIELLMKI